MEDEDARYSDDRKRMTMTKKAIDAMANIDAWRSESMLRSDDSGSMSANVGTVCQNAREVNTDVTCGEGEEDEQHEEDGEAPRLFDLVVMVLG